MAKKKQYNDDDGRTIADMSGIERNPLIIPRLSKKAQNEPKNAEITDTEDRPWENNELSKSERRSIVFGAMSAAALIALLFIIAGAVVIALFVIFSK